MAAPLVSSGYESPWTREVLDAARAGDVERFKHLRRQRGRSSSFAVAQAPARCSAAAAFSPLCHRGADVVPSPGLDGARTCGGNTALHIAAGPGHAHLALFLCQAEWPLLTERNRAGETPLHCAAKAGNARIAGYLLHYLPADAAVVVRAVNRSGETALHEAARGGHEDVVKLLLDKDEDLAGVVSNEGVSALYLAAMSGHEAVVRWLLHRSPEGTKVTPSAVSSAGVDGQTALHAAVLLRNKGK
uniref:Uncharacterized protein n=1 Tax=Oryza brachyantha TaxID=4533 RepID=J3MLF1_ORYBR